MNKKFSDWLKIDLHIHTDLSRKTKNDDYRGNFSVDVLRSKLDENDVRIFSLTDHNIINVDAYREYYEKYSTGDDPLLLLGIELDILRNEKTYHSLLVFKNSSIDDVQIKSDKLEEMYFKKDMNFFDRKLTFDEIVEIFTEDDFFFIPHAGNTASIVDGYRDEIEEAQKMIILLQSPMEKVPEKVKHIYNVNFDTVLYEAFRNKNDYAYIEFSDNHYIDEYPCKHKGYTGEHIFYFIKGSKNYETLRLAFIDPHSRIKSFAELNEIRNRNNYIEQITIESENIDIETPLSFSPHLNVIIGGRSSGKSLLMDILNRNIDILHHNPKYDTILLSSQTKIKSQYDDDFKDITSLDFPIIQINQGDIVNYFENNKLDDLAKKSGNTDSYNLSKLNLRNKKNELENLLNNLQEQYNICYELDLSKQLQIFSKNIQDLLNSDFHFFANLDDIDDNHISSVKLEEYEKFINGMLYDLEQFEKMEILEINDDELLLINSFKEILKNKSNKIDTRTTNRGKIDTFLCKVSDSLKLANSKLSEESQEKAESIQYIQSIVDKSKIHFQSLVNLEKSCNDLESYSMDHTETIELTSEINLCLEVSSSDTVSDLILDGINDSSDKSLFNCLLHLLYNETTVKNYRNNLPESLKRKIAAQLSYLLKQFDQPQDYLNYSDGSNSKSNSPGYNSEKYLQVVLNNPLSKLILIDQPEDNLGNSFISETLVDMIREIKFEKQLFLVTHNPAIVVYGDAESIILATNNENKITYNQIKLENEISQKDICSVLDGGEYIFDNRAKKYNIQKLLVRGE